MSKPSMMRRLVRELLKNSYPFAAKLALGYFLSTARFCFSPFDRSIIFCQKHPLTVVVNTWNGQY